MRLIVHMCRGISNNLVLITLPSLLPVPYSNYVQTKRKQGRKRPLDRPKRMIERREGEGEREKERYTRRDI